ncbi:MAG: hypothetical protein P4L53_09520 [Candidatus Obscuribacterales bacterium]|nr:hypothetical protein [Candidatus Obscuribacterales bacterium]
MSEVKEAVDPKQLALREKSDPVQLANHAHLLSECHVKNTSGHAAEWWKKAHASAIQAMPEEIKCHDAVKGQVGTTLWDIAHASLESQGQKGSVAHEMKRIADLNHISVDCSDLRNKEIRLHDHHAKVVEAPLPPPPPVEKPCPPHHAVEVTPPVRPPDVLPEPKVIMAPDYIGGDRRPLPPPPPERYDMQGYPRPIEPCHQPNILDLLNPFARRDTECRMPPPDGNYDYYRREHRGYREEGQFGIGQLFGGQQLLQGEQYHQRGQIIQREQYHERAASVRLGNTVVQEAPPVQLAPAPMRTQTMRHSYSTTETTTMNGQPCPPGQMTGRNNGMHRR